MALSGAARVAGIVGWPVAHSRSPALHGAWLRRYGIDGAYVPLPVRPEHLADAIVGLRAAGFAGVNVTVPHKVAAMALCDTLSAAARRAGAVNTLVFGADGVAGDNTDGFGFVAHLRASGVDPSRPALLLGAGGAARAIAAALLDEGARVRIANRTPDRAAALARDLGVDLVPWDARAEALADAALLVNTTSLGMHGQPPLAMPLGRAAPGTVVADIVYAPLQTPLLAQARACNLASVDGLGMLLHQGRPGFAAWFGVLPEVDAALARAVAPDLLA